MKPDAAYAHRTGAIPDLRPFFIMLALMTIEASLHAVTTYLVIETGRDVAEGRVRASTT